MASPPPAAQQRSMTVPETPSPGALVQQLQNDVIKRTMAGLTLGPGRFEDNTPSRRSAKARRFDVVAISTGACARSFVCRPGGAGRGVCACMRPLLACLRHMNRHRQVHARSGCVAALHGGAGRAGACGIAAPCGRMALTLVQSLALRGAGRAKSDDVIKYAEALFRKIKRSVAQQHAMTALKASFLDPVHERLNLEVSLELFARSDTDFMTMFTAPGVLAALATKRDLLAKRVDGLLKCKSEFAELARCL